MLQQSLADASCEINCLKSTLEATNEMISSNEEEMKRLQAKVDHSEKKSVRLELELAKQKVLRVEQVVELAQLQTLIAESVKIQDVQRTEIISLKSKVNRLRAESASMSVTHPQQPVALDCSADGSVDEMPIKKRRKMNHKCPECRYSTLNANAMKIHRQEGCRSAVVTKKFSCDVCKAEFTYNRFRYHLNQYTKQSSHAKNGHQKYSPAQHREMLEKLKRTRQE